MTPPLPPPDPVVMWCVLCVLCALTFLIVIELLIGHDDPKPIDDYAPLHDRW